MGPASFKADRVSHVTRSNGERYTNYICPTRGLSRLHGHLSLEEARLAMKAHREKLSKFHPTTPHIQESEGWLMTTVTNQS